MVVHGWFSSAREQGDHARALLYPMTFGVAYIFRDAVTDNRWLSISAGKQMENLVNRPSG